MFKIDDIGGLFMSMPPNLQNAENEAMCYAIDKQIGKLSRLAKKLNVWSDLDNAKPEHYDMMAATINAPYYRSEMTDEQKLNLIKGTPQTKKYLGTKKGVMDFLGFVFRKSVYIPWYEYQGDPYHFKIRVDGEPRDADIDKRFNEMLGKIKALRSQLDTIETERELDMDSIYAARVFGVRIVNIEPYDDPM